MKSRTIPIEYNSQRDNAFIAGVKAFAQCGYTAVSMMLSAFFSDATSDAFVAGLVRRMETAGPLLDRILLKVPWARGRRKGMFGDSYAAAVGMILEERGSLYRPVWIPGGGTVAQMRAAIDAGSPLVLSTMITDFGHYICVVGYDDKHWICHDPYGDGYRGYRTHRDGAFVKYPKAWLESCARRSDPTKKGLRFLYVRKN